MEPTEDELRKLARRRVASRRELLIHLSLYAIANPVLVGIWRQTGKGYPWFVWPMYGWGIGVLAHALTFAFGPDSGSAQRSIARELRRMQRAGA